MKLVVVMPALNEQQTIGSVVRGVPRDIPGITEIDILVVNDHSTDRTTQVAEEAGATVINRTGRSGLGRVFQCGLDRAMRMGADIVVNIDSDGQFDPADIPKLIQPILDGEADFATCTRFADPALRPTMSVAKYIGNRVVTRIINWVCGGTNFTDVSCGFRALDREAVHRLTLFGRFTYTQEMLIDLFSKGVRMTEVPLKVRGERAQGKSRIASSIPRYAIGSSMIILRALRDIRPLRFFGTIAMLLGVAGGSIALFMAYWYLTRRVTTPFRSLIPIGGGLLTLAFVMGVLALLADMIGRHRRITEELLYHARRRMYQRSRLSSRLARTRQEQMGPTAVVTADDTLDRIEAAFEREVEKVVVEAPGGREQISSAIAPAHG